MKGNFYKKITRYYGIARGELWCFGGKSKVRKKIKTNDSRRYRRYRKNNTRKDLDSADPFFFFFVKSTDHIIEQKCLILCMEEKLMKEIYVYKSLIGRKWAGISKEEADTKIKEGRVCGVELEVEREGDEPIKITLLKESFGIFGATDEELKQLVEEYFNYVEEITGMVTKTA